MLKKNGRLLLMVIGLIPTNIFIASSYSYDYWMTASSFNCVPGLPVLHSTDLVNWELVNYALPRMYDTDFGLPHRTAMACGLRQSVSTTVGIISIGATPTAASTWCVRKIRAAPGRNPYWSRLPKASSTPARCGTRTVELIWYMDGPVHVPDLKAC